MVIPVSAEARVADEVLELPDRTCHLRGGIFQAHLRWVEERHGPAALDAVWSRLPEEMRQRPPRDIETRHWLPFKWLVTLDRAILSLFGGGRADILFELGRYSAQLNFSGRLDLLKGLSIHSHFWSAKTHHSLFQDYGSCEYRPLHEQGFRLDYFDYIVRSRVFCLSGLGYFEASVEFLNGVDPIVEEVACQCYGDRTCSYVVTWEKA